ncbi:LysE family translocator [Rhizobium miluonense]|nr:LysE family translocator [Rhizobium miluonense]
MISLGVLTTYIAVVLGLMVIPGPATLLTLARAVSDGRRTGLATGLGIAVGDLFHTMMATFGLSALLATSALAFEIVKYAGVAYLIYLGFKAFREKAESLDMPTAQSMTPMRAFRQGFFTEILNPKTALFFLAFLPQFIHPESGSVIGQFALLGAIFVGLSICVTSLLAVGAGSISGWLRRNSKVGRWQGKIVGAIYMAVGLRLALQQQ